MLDFATGFGDGAPIEQVRNYNTNFIAKLGGAYKRTKLPSSEITHRAFSATAKFPPMSFRISLIA